MSFSARRWCFWPALLVFAVSLSALKPAGASDLGGDWVSRFPTPTNADLYDVATNGSTNIVAVGSRGTILTSTNLVSWATITSGVTDDLIKVIWTGTQYATVGVEGHVLTSPNGTNWTVSTPGNTATDTLQCIAWTGSELVVAGGYTTSSGYACLVLTSTDGGVTWKRRTFPTLLPIKRMVWTGALLVGLMNGATASSIDGSEWAVHPLPAAVGNGGTGTISLVWTGSQLLVSGDTLWNSIDGLSWSEYHTGLTGVVGVNLSWTGNDLVVTNSSSQVFVSADQVNFTNFSSSLPAPEVSATRFATSAGSSLVLVGLGGHIDTQIVSNDSTAGTWTPSNSQSTPLECLGIAQSPSLFVGVGKGISWTSPDGNTWTQHLLASNSFQSVAWSGTQFVAAGSGVWTSPDGVTWTVVSTLPADSTGNQVWFSVNWVGGKGYASGYNYTTGLAMSQMSTDNGTTWTAGDMAEVALGIASDGGTPARLVAVGAGGAVMISTDGTTWSSGGVGLPSGQDFHDVAYGNGQFVAITTGGAIYSSTTGATSWVLREATSASLYGIARTGNEFIVVGSAGSLLRSFDGVNWRLGDSSVSQDLTNVLWTGSRLIAAGASANFITSDGTPPSPPTLQFTATAESITEGGSVGLFISLSQAWKSQITVPLSYSGSAAASRYVTPASPVVFNPGDTSKFIVVDSIDDHISQGTQNIVVTLGTPTGGAVLGTAITNTITVLDNDPAFTTSPVDQLVALGSSFTFSAQMSGAVSYQWIKDGVAIAGAKGASYTVAKAVAASAGTYAVSATDASGVTTTDSGVGRLGVVTVQTGSQMINSGGIFTATATAVGPAGALSYQWGWGSAMLSRPLSDGGGISGSKTSKLTFTNLVPGDTSVYTCQVTLGSGGSAPSMTATTVSLVVNALPVITPPAAITTRVGSPVDFTPSATPTPTKWTITGLPAGLTYSSLNGHITGTPTKGGITSTVTITGSNQYGTGQPVTLSIAVASLPTVTQGSFIVLVPRDVNTNGDLGGRVDLTTTATGTFTGKLTMPVTPLSFSGQLSGSPTGNPGGSVTVTRTAPLPSVKLDFTIDQGTGAVNLTVTVGTAAPYTAVGPAVAVQTAAGTGAYNFALSPHAGSPSGHPAGDGYGQFTVAGTGLLAVAGKLADGTSYTCNSYTATDGSIPLYASTNSGKGSLVGSLGLTLDPTTNYANNSITGPITWYKSVDAGNRSYASGIPLMQLDVDGGRYTAPVGVQIVMNLPTGLGNAKLAFNGGPGDLANLGQASRNPSGNFTVIAPAKVTPPSPDVASTTLVFTPGTGLFNGQFTLSDLDHTLSPAPTIVRTVQYYGVLIRPGGAPAMVGKGFFNLPQMPYISSGTRVILTPIVSGEATLSH